MLIRYANHSARSVALLADDGVMGFRRPSRYFGALGHATECRVEAETVALRAYVTSGCPLVHDARMRTRARYDLTPRRAAGLWPAHERREGLAQHAPPVGGNLRVVASGEGRRRLRCSAGAVAAEVPTLKAAG